MGPIGLGASWIVRPAAERRVFGRDRTSATGALRVVQLIREVALSRLPFNENILRTWNKGRTNESWPRRGALMGHQPGGIMDIRGSDQ